jgi:hypothetical protein
MNNAGTRASLMPAIERLREELSASEAISQMKDLENEELSEAAKLAHTAAKSWYDRAMKAEAECKKLEIKAWQAGAALADCERELADSKVLACQALEYGKAKEAELMNYATHAAFGNIGALIKELHELRQSYDLLHFAHHGFIAGVAAGVAGDSRQSNSPASPLDLPWTISSGSVERIPGAPALVKDYSFGEMLKALRELHPEPVAPMPTRTASSSSA